jgi:hypothetical protein
MVIDSDRRIIVLFIQLNSSAYEKQGASIFMYPSGIWQESNNFFILMSIYCNIQEKSYMFLGLSLSSDSARLEKS